MHTKLTIPERLKDLRVSEKRMSLQELSDATSIPSSTLGNYEKDENIDMSLGNLITLANFYNVSTDYLLCRTELRKHKNQSVSDLHLNDDSVQILTDEKYNPRLLSELLTHENFKKFMTDLEIYIDGFNDKGIQIANAFLDVMRCKLTELGADSTDTFASVFDNSHIESEQYYIRHKRLNCFMQLAGICTMAFVNEGYNIALCLKILRQVFQKLLPILVDI